MQSVCESCRFAEIDYETFYGTTKRQYFISGCKCTNSPISGSVDPDGNVTECSEYEEDR